MRTFALLVATALACVSVAADETAASGVAVGVQGTFMVSDNDGYTWETYLPKPSTKDLRAVFFTDDATGWVAGNQGTIYYTFDAGGTWTEIKLPTDYDFRDIFFFGSALGWIVGTGGTLFLTNNGGYVWHWIDVETAGTLTSVAFVSASTGWIVGTHGLIMKTTDGGYSWSPRFVTTMDFLSVCFQDSLRGWAVGAGGTICRTADGGASWREVQINTASTLNSICFAGGSNGWIAGDEGLLLHSSDGGDTWTAQFLESSFDLTAIHFSDTSNGWIATNGGHCYRTFNGGTTWNRIEVAPGVPLNDIIVRNESPVISVNPSGTGDYPTIQAAINNAEAGETVLLEDGTYIGNGNRNIDFKGKAITIRSRSGDPQACTIDCEGNALMPGRGFTFQTGETNSSVLSGVRIINAYGQNSSSYGGALVITTISGPVIENCIIENCYNYFGGGGLMSYGGKARIINCAFIQNDGNIAGFSSGGAVYIQGSGISFENCRFEGNTAYYGGAVYIYSSGGTIPYLWRFSSCEFENNSAEHGGAIYMDDWRSYFNNRTLEFVDCVMHGNISSVGTIYFDDEGEYIYPFLTKTIVSNTTITGNTAGGVNSIIAGLAPQMNLKNSIIASNAGRALDYSVFSVKCTDIYGNSGGNWTGDFWDSLGVNGNIEQDPLFCGGPGLEYYIHATSPCAPGSNPSCGLIGAYPVGCGAGTACSMFPDMLEFGSVPIAEYEDLSAAISNSGTEDLMIDISMAHPNFDIVTGEGAHILEPGETHYVVVRFRPTSGISYSGSLETGGPYGSIACAGSGDAEAVSGSDATGVPSRYSLHQNYPNPFNPSTTVEFDVPAPGGDVSIKVYDVRGSLVAVLIDSWREGGRHAFVWDGRSADGRRVSTGMYFCKLTAGDFIETRKLILLQ